MCINLLPLVPLLSLQARPCTFEQCGHRICPTCAGSVLRDALKGSVPIPIACPEGCCSGSGHSFLKPMEVMHVLDEEEFERFARLHDVRTSLAQSAPHSGGLKGALAQARLHLDDNRSKVD